MVLRRSKHMSARVARVRGVVTHGTVESLIVSSTHNGADMSTKQLPGPRYASGVNIVYNRERVLTMPVGAFDYSAVNIIVN